MSTFNPVLLKTEQNYVSEIQKTFTERKYYQKTDKNFSYGYIGERYLGTYLDIDDYYNHLYELSQLPTVYVLDENMDKTIPNEMFQALQEILGIHAKEKLSVNRLVSFLTMKNLIPRQKDAGLERHVLLALIHVFTHYQQMEQQGLQSGDFRRVFIDLIKWINNYWPKWDKDIVPDQHFPTIIWYGNAKKSHQYFIYFLLTVGFDVLLFHPEGTDVLQEIENKRTAVYTLQSQGSLEPFPTKMQERKATITKTASNQIEQVMHNEHSLLYKPWQFRTYTPSPLTLKTTYDEIIILGREKAFLRPNFKIENKHVMIPNLFAKVYGVSTDQKEFNKRIQELRSCNHTLLIDTLPFTKAITSNFQYHYQHASTNDGKLLEDKMLQGNWWQYGRLPEDLQHAIAKTIIKACESTSFKSVHGENREATTLYLFTQLSRLPDNIVQLLQKFDYTQDIPKILVFNNETNGELSRSDAAALYFLNMFGFDLVVFNPAQHRDIEEYIDASLFDCHWLEEVQFNYSLSVVEEGKQTIMKFFRSVLPKK